MIDKSMGRILCNINNLANIIDKFPPLHFVISTFYNIVEISVKEKKT